MKQVPERTEQKAYDPSWRLLIRDKTATTFLRLWTHARAITAKLMEGITDKTSLLRDIWTRCNGAALLRV